MRQKKQSSSSAVGKAVSNTPSRVICSKGKIGGNFFCVRDYVFTDPLCPPLPVTKGDVLRLLMARLQIVRPRVTAKSVIEAVADFFGMTEDDLLFSRKHLQCDARKIAFYLVLEVCGYSLRHIAREFGKDHSTVFKSIRKVKSWDCEGKWTT